MICSSSEKRHYGQGMIVSGSFKSGDRESFEYARACYGFVRVQQFELEDIRNRLQHITAGYPAIIQQRRYIACMRQAQYRYISQILPRYYVIVLYL